MPPKHGRGGPVNVYRGSSGTTPNPNDNVREVENQLLKGRTSTTFTITITTESKPAKSTELTTTTTTAASDAVANTVSVTLPARPSYGVKGFPLILWANYVSLQLPPQLVLYQYSLSVQPLAVGKKLAQIVRLLLESPELQPLQRDIATDFASTVIAKKQLPNQKQAIKLRYRAEGEDEPPEKACEYHITLKLVKTLPVADATRHLASTSLSSQDGDRLSVVQALNILVNHQSKSSDKIATIGASKNFRIYDKDNWVNLTSGLQVRRGFFTSVRAATARMLLNVNLCHSAFYDPVPLDELIGRFFGDSHTTDTRKLEAFLKRLRVEPTHLKDKAGKAIIRPKTIYGLATRTDGEDLAHPPIVLEHGAGPKDVEFWLDSPPPGQQSSSTSGRKPVQSASVGGYISVYRYFTTVRNQRIHDPELPVVNVGTALKPSYLPAQYCRVLRGQVMRNRLNPKQTQKMIEFAVQEPAASAKSIVPSGLPSVTSDAGKPTPLGNFEASVSSNFITVQGRLLPEPKVSYGGNKQAQVIGGSWNMFPSKPNSEPMHFCAPVRITKWACLAISEVTKENTNKFVKRFTEVLKATGVIVEKDAYEGPRPIEGIDDPKLDERFARAAKSNFQLLLVILPTGPGATLLYNRVKHLGDIKYGIHTICCVRSKIVQPNDVYLLNVALKVNLKLGGKNHLVQPVDLGLVAEGKTMVVGIDVTHPSPGSSDAAPSVSAMVASVNETLNQWPGTLKIQSERRQEMVSDLKDMLTSRLELWRKPGKSLQGNSLQGKPLPENILVYRDGVSEGQYAAVLKTELPQLRDACQNLYPPKDQAKGLPRITIVVVGKRHHTRFYPTKNTDADGSGNPKAGTVVDRGVTEARNWDFFLQSHAAVKGTARPAHYYVLLDEIFNHRYGGKMNVNVADELQKLTQSICYVFGRATKAVSYCTPAYYADILCERARRYLSHVFEPSAGGDGSQPNAAHNESIQIHEKLKDTMFYI
ncbi:ribonuclease H-like domain-containing protein [Nemania sp. NC0429]|nr:ribonuclease H-like domain-containing protein [Nemania sp. NC0429]